MPWLVFAVVLGAILSSLAWLASRVRRRGVGHQMSGPVDMIFRPHTYDLSIEMQIQQERMEPRTPVDDKHKTATDEPGTTGPATPGSRAHNTRPPA